MGAYIKAELARVELELTLEENRQATARPVQVLTTEDIRRLNEKADYLDSVRWRGMYGLRWEDRFQRSR